MLNIAGVRFQPSGLVHYFDAGDLQLEPGDTVEVETEDGPVRGRVVFTPQQLVYSDLKGPLSPVLVRVEGASGPGSRG